MTATTLSHLPLQAGSALATGAGRAIVWAASRYARAPLANTCILALTVLTAMAGSNALYFQTGRHPAPLFGTPSDVEIGLPEPVTPVTRRSPLTVPDIVVIDQTGSTPAAAPVETPRPIGNAAIVELQRKLTTLGLYDGKVDGIFGPKTSGAIKRFEERAGLTPSGRLTPEILDTIARAPLVLPQALATSPRPLAVEPIVVVAPVAQQPAVAQQLPTATIATAEITGSIPPADIGMPNPAAPEDSFQPLPAPEPLALSVQAATQPEPLIAPRRDLPDSPREALTIAVANVRNGLEALASVIENGPQLGPTPKPVAPIPATQSVQPTPQIEQVQQVEPPGLQPAVLHPEPAPIIAKAGQQPMPPVVTVAPPPAETAFLVAETAPVANVPASGEPMTERELIGKVQRGLTSLGFLRGEIDGVAGEATAKAIRNFEVYYNYDVTGRVSPGLVDLLIAAGAQI